MRWGRVGLERGIQEYFIGNDFFFPIEYVIHGCFVVLSFFMPLCIFDYIYIYRLYQPVYDDCLFVSKSR